MYEIDDKLNRPICKTSRQVTVSESHYCWCAGGVKAYLRQEVVEGVDGIH